MAGQVTFRQFSSGDHAKQVVKDKLIARNFEQQDAEQVSELCKKYYETSKLPLVSPVRRHMIAADLDQIFEKYSLSKDGEHRELYDRLIKWRAYHDHKVWCSLGISQTLELLHGVENLYGPDHEI